MKSLLQSTAIDMDVTGYDESTGYGFIQADRALQSFSNSFPLIQNYYLQDSTKVPGDDPVSIVINGEYFSDSASVIFQYDTIQAVVSNGTQLIAEIPAFLGNPPLEIYNPPMAPSGLDGGASDPVYLKSLPPQNVKVTVNDAIKNLANGFLTIPLMLSLMRCLWLKQDFLWMI